MYSISRTIPMAEQTTDHNKATVPGSLVGSTRGSAQQACGNWLEANP